MIIPIIEVPSWLQPLIARTRFYSVGADYDMGGWTNADQPVTRRNVDMDDEISSITDTLRGLESDIDLDDDDAFSLARRPKVADFDEESYADGDSKDGDDGAKFKEDDGDIDFEEDDEGLGSVDKSEELIFSEEPSRHRIRERQELHLFDEEESPLAKADGTEEELEILDLKFTSAEIGTRKLVD
jgi:hypothetical protein